MTGSISLRVNTPSGLQCDSESRWPYGSRPFHDFDWYNSHGMEKCPLAVNRAAGRNALWSILVSGRQSVGLVNSAVKLIKTCSNRFGYIQRGITDDDAK